MPLRRSISRITAPSTASLTGGAILSASSERWSRAEMQALVDEPPAAGGDHLVGGIGELDSRDPRYGRGLAVREIAAVDIGDARHGNRRRC